MSCQYPTFSFSRSDSTHSIASKFNRSLKCRPGSTATLVSGNSRRSGVQRAAEVLDLALALLLHLVHELADLLVHALQVVGRGLLELDREAGCVTGHRGVLDLAAPHDDHGGSELLREPDVPARGVERALALFGVLRAEPAPRHVVRARVERPNDDRLDLDPGLAVAVGPAVERNGAIREPQLQRAEAHRDRGEGLVLDGLQPRAEARGGERVLVGDTGLGHREPLAGKDGRRAVGGGETAWGAARPDDAFGRWSRAP